MENNRPKIASLSTMELATLLHESFFKIGKEVKLSAIETKIFIEEVLKYQGWIFTDTFREAFSKYAADEIPDADTLRPQVSPRFISRLMKLYFKKCKENKRDKTSGKNTCSVLTPEEKYTLFVKFIVVNQSLPCNADWVTIYEHLAGLKKLPMPAGWDSMTFCPKWKYAMEAVTTWVYNNFNITEILHYKNPEE